MRQADLHALNAERLRQWSERLTDEGASAIVTLGVAADTGRGRVTVLWPEGAAVADVIRLLLHAANTVALEWAAN